MVVSVSLTQKKNSMFLSDSCLLRKLIVKNENQTWDTRNEEGDQEWEELGWDGRCEGQRHSGGCFLCISTRTQDNENKIGEDIGAGIKVIKDR